MNKLAFILILSLTNIILSSIILAPVTFQPTPTTSTATTQAVPNITTASNTTNSSSNTTQDSLNQTIANPQNTTTNTSQSQNSSSLLGPASTTTKVDNYSDQQANKTDNGQKLDKKSQNAGEHNGQSCSTDEKTRKLKNIMQEVIYKPLPIQPIKQQTKKTGKQYLTLIYQCKTKKTQIHQNSNPKSSKYTFNLQNSKNIVLDFTSHVFQDNGLPANSNIVLNAKINNKITSINLAQGKQARQLTINGLQGANEIYFSIEVQDKCNGLVYATLSNFSVNPVK